MFRVTLQAQLKRIFDFDKVTFDLPSESQEQEGVFVQVESARWRIKDAKQIARVTGTIRVFANQDKLAYGYFNKKISEAYADDTRNLFFFDFEENKGTFRNIVERSMGFLYLFDSQYDPSIGTLNEITLTYGG